MASKPVLPFLETMITQVCNLACQGCTNYSDLPQNGFVTWQQGKAWILPWLERLEIPDFGIMGGEPLINPECRDWLIGIRNIMPQSQIRFTTNATLLHRHWDIVDLMHDLGNVSFKITVHLDDGSVQEIVDRVFDSYPWRPVREYGIDRWVTTNGFRFHVKRPEVFIKTYRGQYHDMMPWNSDPDMAFANCCQKTCPLIHQGRLHKCSTAGLLKHTVEKTAPHLAQHWHQYMDHGLAPDCSQQELEAFLANFGQPHDRCAQCPTAEDQDAALDHVKLVSFKSHATSIKT